MQGYRVGGTDIRGDHEERGVVDSITDQRDGKAREAVDVKVMSSLYASLHPFIDLDTHDTIHSYLISSHPSAFHNP
jgi:hypothetical protein